MMRLLVTLFIVIGLITPLYALETQLIYEDFEGAAPGTLFNTFPGWSGPDGFVISDTTIDQGQSLDCSGGPDAWPRITHSISYTPAAEEQYVFSGTLWVESTSNDYAHAQLRVDGDARLWVGLGYSNLIYQYEFSGSTSQLTIPMVLNEDQTVATMDFKLVISGDSFDGYWRVNGDTEWIYAGQVVDGIDMAEFTQVDLYGHGGYPGKIDTIRLAVVSTDEYLPGDANKDNKVDGEDAALLAANWQTLTGATWGMGDFNGDEAVDDIDATILASNWQTSTATASVPEPGTMALLCLGGFMLLLSLRKRSA